MRLPYEALLLERAGGNHTKKELIESQVAKLMERALMDK